MELSVRFCAKPVRRPSGLSQAATPAPVDPRTVCSTLLGTRFRKYTLSATGSPERRQVAWGAGGMGPRSGSGAGDGRLRAHRRVCMRGADYRQCMVRRAQARYVGSGPVPWRMSACL